MSEPYGWHADGDQCLGPDCLNVDEATGDHSTDVHSDDWWEGFAEAGRRVLLSSPETTPDRLEGLRVKEGDPAARMPYFDPATLIGGTAPETTPAGVLDEAAERMIVTVRASHGPVRHYPCDICDRADALAAALALQPAGVLDEAWAAAEKALPMENGVSLGWAIDAVNRDGDRGWEAVASWRYVDPVIGSGPTPAAALLALAAALGRSGSGGGRG